MSKNIDYDEDFDNEFNENFDEVDKDDSFTDDDEWNMDKVVAVVLLIQ